MNTENTITFDVDGPVATQAQIDAKRHSQRIAAMFFKYGFFLVYLAAVGLALIAGSAMSDYLVIKLAHVAENDGLAGWLMRAGIFFFMMACSLGVPFALVMFPMSYWKFNVQSLDPVELHDGPEVLRLNNECPSAEAYRERVIAVRVLVKGDLHEMRRCKKIEKDASEKAKSTAVSSMQQDLLDRLNGVNPEGVGKYKSE